MPANPNLERNQSILWARDILSRPDDCVLVVGSTLADGSISQTGEIWLVALTGAKIYCSTSSAIQTDSLALRANAKGKEFVHAAIPSSVLSELALIGKANHDLLGMYGQFVQNPNCGLAASLSPAQLAEWMHDTLNTMAGSSLTLDQADTGAGKWTGAHFKPSSSMLEKFKSLLKD